MAKLPDGPGAFTGTIGNLIYYRRRDKPGYIFVRRKGGVSKERIKNDPKFARTRENNSEFTGRSKSASLIRDAIQPLPTLADYNFLPVLTGIMNKVQKGSDQEERGKRSIFISKLKGLLESFHLNDNIPFTSVVRQSFTITINRQGTADILVPALTPEINLFVPWKSPYYRLVCTFSAVPDQVYDGFDFMTCPGVKAREYMLTPWQLVSKPAAAQALSMQLQTAITETDTLIVGIGIEMGMPTGPNEISTVARQGAAMISRTG